MKRNNKLPGKTIERLSQYRRSLLLCLAQEKTHIFSHEIAALLHITPVQVRRDIMLIGYTGTLRQGYDIRELIDLIGEIIDSQDGLNVAVIGLGNLGRAILTYLSGKRTKLRIAAAFDINPEKVDKVYGGVPCYPLDRLQEILEKEEVSIGILTVPATETAGVANTLVNCGIKGILNYTPKPINVPPHVYLQEYDMITSLEKVAYFVKRNQQPG
ncbi:MAG TPA: redox-sensing transcriptional repressor Rex [Bacteroidales bacterium]|nr:redox-sensing transcriptional repressor Rex [Bacteroidales bacterium]HRZ75761.1 redox-sensing transcriptional repressor Rex [Bacteroidales bacterium]